MPALELRPIGAHSARQGQPGQTSQLGQRQGTSMHLAVKRLSIRLVHQEALRDLFRDRRLKPRSKDFLQGARLVRFQLRSLGPCPVGLEDLSLTQVAKLPTAKFRQLAAQHWTVVEQDAKTAFGSTSTSKLILRVEKLAWILASRVRWFRESHPKRRSP